MQLMSEKGAAGGGLRERKKRATRAALAEAAVRLAAEHGAEKVTVEAISAAAGVSVRTFFNYFDSRDDAFVVVDADAGARMRRAVLDAPAELSPLEALREAMAAELAEAEQQHELWRLHAKVLHASPHLLARGVGAHMAAEADLADAIAERLRGVGGTSGPGSGAGPGSVTGPGSGLYPRLLAAVAGAAVRTSMDHWSAHQEEAAFLDVFHEVFTLLAAGLPAPSA
ncbi:TetR/AcrR family transcriptional regulator [Streptomyces sp. ICN988]|uniref:TetR/AcrR family transcriptional regulator n=1 Tax=unclassified Streptomyces TaxID=2593676 RepID=UPI001590A383|nr:MULTISPECIES: TetR/AcrR family transcriptional regulator [unclassified Streptomyces]WST99451.1 TetR/AcrR family transcriptional regulator [Streptomyces sp. NBC_01124]MBH5131544.1 TetR family transcriptional regulator [Streptomyces sp. HB-N217]MCV2459222.1 TetR/AcrR family transcriptional regulator [Streptomyces sp. ICN988]MDU0258101.1 helix-turn-helix domain-containing protein [Streptomyces sp. PU10]QKW59277.1 TetR family transcriptional regulator [Streptomyces sp. NA03103]